MVQKSGPPDTVRFKYPTPYGIDMVGNPNLTTHRYEMDTALAAVMPDSWNGHARIAAYEEADDLPDDAREFAVSLANRLAEKKDASAERLATVSVEKTREKFL